MFDFFGCIEIESFIVFLSDGFGLLESFIWDCCSYYSHQRFQMFDVNQLEMFSPCAATLEKRLEAVEHTRANNVVN